MARGYAEFASLPSVLTGRQRPLSGANDLAPARHDVLDRRTFRCPFVGPYFGD